MPTGASVVLDVGKTLTKASLWRDSGEIVDRRQRANARVDGGDYLALDVGGIEEWLQGTLSGFSQLNRLSDIIVVGHGAAAALVRDGQLLVPALDYEHAIPRAVREQYEAQREPFTLTGSPSLPDGLNLGRQLHFLEHLYPALWQRPTSVLPWPQYWTWRLCGRAVSEVTSLGCHTDLWYPQAARFSRHAERRGWTQQFAPLARASDTLGAIAPEWVERCGVPADVKVRCGLHDSNAALLSARAAMETDAGDMTVLSTGTWFVAMRIPHGGRLAGLETMPSDRDCLVNVDVNGDPVPSARFMGGREMELLLGNEAQRMALDHDERETVAAGNAVVTHNAMVLPSFVAGSGPFGAHTGCWLSRPEDALQRWAAVCLYAALVADAALDLIGSKETLIVEGRFAQAALFVGALAALRPDSSVRVSSGTADVALGALHLMHPDWRIVEPLRPVRPLPFSLQQYKEHWRSACARRG